jgi:hypothetical protein
VVLPLSKLFAAEMAPLHLTANTQGSGSRKKFLPATRLVLLNKSGMKAKADLSSRS